MPIGVIVARFQIDDLHEGHKYLIDAARTASSRVIVFLGVSPVRGSIQNPLDFESRKQMVLQNYPYNVTVLPLMDTYDNKSWSAELDRRIDEAAPGQNVMLYSGEAGFRSAYCGVHSFYDLQNIDSLTATQVRNSLAGAPLNSADFRAGVIYGAASKRPVIVPTVDIAVWRKTENGVEVLLGQRPGLNHLRFPGGFVDFDDHNFEVAASRELKEETGIDRRGLDYIGTQSIDADWRYCSCPDMKIMTTLFAMELGEQDKVKEDLTEFSGMYWIGADTANIMSVEDSHRALFQTFIYWVVRNVK